MKKSKVDAIIKKHVAAARAEALAEGQSTGRRIERDKWTAYVGEPGRDGVVWLDNYPRETIKTIMLRPYLTAMFADYARPFTEHMRLDFEAVPMALSLADGTMVRWMHWKPRGPYPGHELAVVR